MKKIIFTITTVVAMTATFAQTKSGTIVYEEKMNMHRRITDEQMRAMIPEFRTSRHQLLFSDSTSVYKAIPEDETPDPFTSNGGATVMIRNVGDAGEQYRNYATSKAIDSRELGSKMYIIEDSIRPGGWKLTDETKQVLNFPCRKATRQSQRGENMEAWYTETIPCPVGPGMFGGLPGAMLQLDINNGEVVYTATAVSDKVNKNEISEPKKGKKVTDKEFAKITEEMFGVPGGGGGRVVRIVN